MSLLSKLLVSFRRIGVTRPVCPYCEESLDKMPGRKKKCPSCGNAIYVRTRPGTKTRILVRQDQLLAVEEQWARVNGTYPQFAAEQKRRRRVERRLAKKFGHEPADNDVEWAILNEDAMTHASQMDWGLYRCVRYSMSRILAKEGKQRQALSFLLEVCFLDLNGPNNCGGERDPQLLREFPPFNPKFGDLAPAVVGDIHDAMQDTEQNLAAVEAAFFQMARTVAPSLHLPLPPDKAWRKLKRAIKDLA